MPTLQTIHFPFFISFPFNFLLYFSSFFFVSAFLISTIRYRSDCWFIQAESSSPLFSPLPRHHIFFFVEKEFCCSLVTYSLKLLSSGSSVFRLPFFFFFFPFCYYLKLIKLAWANDGSGSILKCDSGETCRRWLTSTLVTLVNHGRCTFSWKFPAGGP